MPVIIIATLSEITKDNAQVFSVSEDRVISIPDEFLCVAVDEAQESFQTFKTSNKGQTVTNLLKLKEKTQYWFVIQEFLITSIQGTSVCYLVGYRSKIYDGCTFIFSFSSCL
jgi:hypothetical protein